MPRPTELVQSTDFISGTETDNTGLDGTVRLTRYKDGLQISIDGGPPTPLGTGDNSVTQIVAGDNITISPEGGTGDVTVSLGPAVSGLPRFQLALSFGQGTDTDDLPAAASFWLTPQAIDTSIAADQVCEWPVTRELLFISFTAFVDTAEIVLASGGDDPRFIITLDGEDTIYQVALTEGSHESETLQCNGVVDILPGSRIGVRFDGTGVDTGSTMRCECILDGAETGEPIPPPPIPTSGLLTDYASENYAIADLGGGNASGTWTDASGNSNTATTGGTLLAHVPTIVPGAFNDDIGIGATRADTFGMVKTGPTFIAGNAARTFAAVIKGGNIDLGELFHRRSASGNSWSVDITNASSPQPFWANTAGTIDNNGTFIDLNGEKAVLMLWTTGGIGDDLFASVNGVTVPLTGTMAAEGAATNYIEIFGFTFGPRFEGLAARLLWWNRVLTTSERIGVVSNLSARYL